MHAPALIQEYRRLLLEGCVPFWRKHGVDHEYGGVMTCMEESGRRVSEEKYLWSQGRWLWVCSALYNRIEPRPEFLEWAHATAEFLLAHGRDQGGRWVFRTDRRGRVLEGPISIFPDCFAVYGLSEYYRATRSRPALDAATETFERICARIEAPGFNQIAPFELPAGLRIHSVPMILTEVANELAQTSGSAQAEAVAERCVTTIMHDFVRPGRLDLREFLTLDGREASAPAGTLVIPGHAIESMWFVMHWARRHRRKEMIARAAEVIRWHLEKGWDPAAGGLLSAIDLEGHPPFWTQPEMKLWWPHTEALYALQLCRQLTGQAWCDAWYQKVHEWAVAHFALPGGEWRQRLDRSGRPSTLVACLPVKDPFHLPRAAILLLQLLEES